MKAKICRIVILFSIIFEMNANENISLKNYFGMGVMRSSVYESVYQFSKKQSEIKWDAEILPFFVDEISLKLYNLNFLLGFNTVVPIKNGNIIDKDWLFSDKTLLSNYSYHENFIDKKFSLYFKTSYNIFLFSQRLNINTGFSILYSNEKYSAKNGYYQYSLSENKEVDANTAKTDLYGTVMNYEISAFIPICFIGIQLKLTERNCLFFEFDFSPYTFVDSIDTHILRLDEFYDDMEGGFSFCLKNGFCHVISKSCVFDLSTSFYFLNVLGKSGTRKIGIDSTIERTSDVESGLKKYELEIDFGIILNIF